ncbi:DUF6801 domain-containing protein [Mumia qirimensis]|uniref:DUF6801 domain-containing protein n=1 Tax=Mumia qirimensis TaxID=3234852 RepID=UPI00351D52F9
MRVSAAAARRGSGLVATAGLIAGGLAVVAAPAAHAADARVERVGYTCKATNPIVDASLQGPQQFYVTAETTLPDSVAAGDTVPQTDASLTLFLPVKLVDRLTGPMAVERVKGSATSDVVIDGVAPGGEVVESMTKVVSNLVAPNWVTLTPGKEVPIKVTGQVEPIDVPEIPEGNGLIYVQMPPSFVLHSEMDPPVLGSIAKADLKCTRDANTRAARVIGTIPVGEGCEESECPLPAAGGGVTDPEPGGDGDGGGTGGEDPPVIDPTTTPVDDDGNGDGGNGNGNGGDDDDADVAPYTTTALPATGAPVGVGIIALLGLAALGRVALAVRSRRRSPQA